MRRSRKIEIVYYTCPRCGAKTAGLSRSITSAESLRQKYWWSKCYVKYKTPKHYFYNEAKAFINNYENNTGENNEKI